MDFGQILDSNLYDQVCKYASMHVYASMQACKYASINIYATKCGAINLYVCSCGIFKKYYIIFLSQNGTKISAGGEIFPQLDEYFMDMLSSPSLRKYHKKFQNRPEKCHF